MSIDLDGKPRVVGIKQTRKALKEGSASIVYIASDAEPDFKAEVESLCESEGVTFELGCSMSEMGEAAGIDIGAAVITVLK